MQNLEQFFVFCVNCTLINQLYIFVYNFVSIFGVFAHNLPPLTLDWSVHVNIFLIQILDSERGAIIASNLSLKSKFAVTQTSHKFLVLHPSLLFGKQFGSSFRLERFRIGDLLRGKMLKNVVLNFEEMNTQFYLERLCELLRQVHNQIKHVLFGISCQKSLLN